MKKIKRLGLKDILAAAEKKRQALMEKEFGRKAKPGFHLTRNLMSNKVIEVADGTPLCCDPSSETYWSI